MKVYQDMIGEVLIYGTRKENRTGVDTLSTFNYNYELCWDWSSGKGIKHVLHAVDGPGYAVPLLTTKEISWKNIVIEMLWFLSGSTNIEILRRHGCKFWDCWADDNGYVPSAYGHFWRAFPVPSLNEPGVENNDQLAWVVQQLRTNPMSRRLVVSAWEPDNAQSSALPPCHFALCFNVQLNRDGEQRLCLHLTQRSCDLALGVPYNMASYGLLLLIMSHLTGIKPGIFAHTLIDLHIYTSKENGDKAEWDHVPGLEEQLSRQPGALPRLIIDPSIKELSDIEALMKPDANTMQVMQAFKLEGYDPAPAIKFKVAV